VTGTSRQPISSWPSLAMNFSKNSVTKFREGSSCGRKHIATA
jgi:hypothetical protein